MVFGTSIGPAVVGKLLDLHINYDIILFGMFVIAIVASISLAITMTKAPKLLPQNKI